MILVACYLIYLSSDSSQNLKEQVKIIFTPPCHPLILPFFTSLSFSLSDGHGSDSRTSLVRLPNPLFLWELGDLLVKVPSAYSNLKVIVWLCAATYVVSSVQIIQDLFFEALTPKDTISIWQQFLIHMFTEVRLPLWRTGGNQICHLKCQQLLHRRKKKKRMGSKASDLYFYHNTGKTSENRNKKTSWDISRAVPNQFQPVSIKK